MRDKRIPKDVCGEANILVLFGWFSRLVGTSLTNKKKPKPNLDLLAPSSPARTRAMGYLLVFYWLFSLSFSIVIS